jgi:hypothetical protein
MPLATFHDQKQRARDTFDYLHINGLTTKLHSMRPLLLLCALLYGTLGAAQPTTPYFQQEVNYTIRVSLDDDQHRLLGDIAMAYTNNSPDVLHEIWMHVWPNAYSDRNTALAQQLYRDGNLLLFYAFDRVRGGIDSLDFKVNGLPAQWAFDANHVDIVSVKLNEPLQPGMSMTISTPFRVKLPSGQLSRLGHIGQSYQITQWYPKPAVYDRDGWHAMPYLNQGEFYSEFGSFDVEINLPAEYVVGATGDLVDGEAELRFLDSLAALPINFKRKVVDPVDTGDQSGLTHPPVQGEKKRKTLRYRQENVHDFAWFADKTWHVRKGEVTLESGHKVTTWAMFTPRNAPYWERGLEYIGDGILHYSKHIGEYPYNQVTAVDGTISAGGGMEYPNVTVIGNVNSDLSLETVIVHEVGHNWYYGMLGSNERVNAWLDEGFNSYHETRYFIEKYGDSLRLGDGILPANFAERIEMRQFPYPVGDEIMALLSARMHQPQPLQCHSNDYTSLNYGAVVYKKTAVALRHLEHYLGTARFDLAMKNYFKTWGFKHPNPVDVQASFEATTGEDLSWFFNDMVKTTGHINYRIKRARTRDGKTIVRVANEGDIAAPFVIQGLKNGEIADSAWLAPLAPWSDASYTFERDDLDQVVIDQRRVMMEYDRKNNSSRTRGLLRKAKPVQVRFLTRVEDPNKKQLFWAPAIAWNNQNHWMLGLHLHNTTLPFRDWEFALTPMYSIATGTLTGFARTSFYRDGLQLHLTSRSFRGGDIGLQSADYWRNAFEVIQKFNAKPRSAWSSQLELELVHFGQYVRGGSENSDLLLRSSSAHFMLPQVGFQAERSNAFISHTWRVTGRYATSNNDEEGLYTALNYTGSYRYNKAGKRLNWRGFAGYTSDLSTRNGFFPLGGFGLNGRMDIFADHLFLSRSGGALPGFGEGTALVDRQVTQTQGGMRLPIAANRFMASAVLDYELPIKLPFALFAGAVVYESAVGVTDTDFSAGISLNVIKNVVAIHIPLISRGLLEGTYAPQHLISFEFHLDRIAPARLVRTIGG